MVNCKKRVRGKWRQMYFGIIPVRSGLGKRWIQSGKAVFVYPHGICQIKLNGVICREGCAGMKGGV